MSPPVRSTPPQFEALSPASPTPETIAILRAIDADVQSQTGHEAFPESVWSALTDPERGALLATAGTGDAAALSYRSDSFTPSHRQLAVGARPGTSAAIIGATLAAIVASRAIDDDLVAWIPGATEEVVAALTDARFTIDRTQYQLRVPLPLDELATWPDGVASRPFVPVRDEAAWLQVNNRAFANHPDQGGWIREVLDRRMAEPWFDAAGLVMAWRADELVGYCWTKVHTQPEQLGEIFVIGVDPSAQGLGLGRALVLAGLDYLATVRQCATGVLYVAAHNTAAVGLYRSLGFTTFRTDVSLILERAS